MNYQTPSVVMVLSDTQGSNMPLPAIVLIILLLIFFDVVPVILVILGVSQLIIGKWLLGSALIVVGFIISYLLGGE